MFYAKLLVGTRKTITLIKIMPKSDPSPQYSSLLGVSEAMPLIAW